MVEVAALDHFARPLACAMTRHRLPANIHASHLFCASILRTIIRHVGTRHDRSSLLTTPNSHGRDVSRRDRAEYKIFPVDIAKGDQFKPEFLKVTPNHRVALVDHEPRVAARPDPADLDLRIRRDTAVSGRETASFCRADVGRYDTIQWTFYGRWEAGADAAQPSLPKLRRGPSTAIWTSPAALRRARQAGYRNRSSSPAILRSAAISGSPWVTPYPTIARTSTTSHIFKHWLETIGATTPTVRAYAITRQSMGIQPHHPAPTKSAAAVRQTSRSHEVTDLFTSSYAASDRVSMLTLRFIGVPDAVHVLAAIRGIRPGHDAPASSAPTWFVSSLDQISGAPLARWRPGAF